MSGGSWRILLAADGQPIKTAQCSRPRPSRFGSRIRAFMLSGGLLALNELGGVPSWETANENDRLREDASSDSEGKIILSETLTNEYRTVYRHERTCIQTV